MRMSHEECIRRLESFDGIMPVKSSLTYRIPWYLRMASWIKRTAVSFYSLIVLCCTIIVAAFLGILTIGSLSLAAGIFMLITWASYNVGRRRSSVTGKGDGYRGITIR